MLSSLMRGLMPPEGDCHVSLSIALFIALFITLFIALSFQLF